MRALVVPGPVLSNRRKQKALTKFSVMLALTGVSRAVRCLAMNADKLDEGERCASTSNQYEGRQGRGGRTHLVSHKWQLPLP